MSELPTQGIGIQVGPGVVMIHLLALKQTVELTAGECADFAEKLAESADWAHHLAGEQTDAPA